MAAEPASRLNEQSTPADYFALFGIPRHFAIDRAALEKRFYELSRESHPDRFATAGGDQQRQALVRMSLLNEAYRTLKDPAELRRYYLKLEGFVPPEGKPQVPMDLANAWFELQDAQAENPEDMPFKIKEFEHEFEKQRKRSEEELAAIEKALDADGPKAELLAKFSQTILAQNYLQSLERDVARIKADG